ncbi:MAG: hypothetical protein VX990_05000 [Pseudomonadota bacterium]|jgi:hypothetical protein|nr:hypothetical protein [Pseudomonadota bacterium]
MGIGRAVIDLSHRGRGRGVLVEERRITVAEIKNTGLRSGSRLGVTTATGETVAK